MLKVTIEANLELAVQLLSTHEKLVEEEYKYEYFAGKIMFMKAVQIRSSKQRCLRQVTGNQPKLA